MAAGNPKFRFVSTDRRVREDRRFVAGKGRFAADVALPNINCKKCTIQVVQFMAEHGANNPGNYSYHHCAELQIVADPAKPIDKEWPAERQ